MRKTLSSPCASARGRLAGTFAGQTKHSLGISSPGALRVLLAALVIACYAGPGKAGDAPALAALLQQAEQTAPRLLEQAAHVRAAGADSRQAHAWLNPQLGITAENLNAPKAGGVSQRQDTYTLTQLFELGGKRSARIAAEERKWLAAGAREHQVKVSFAGELAVAYATAEAAQMRKELLDAEMARAQDDLRVAEALVQAGREAQLRLAQARASAAAAQAAVQGGAADASEALEQLSALAGVIEPYTRITQPFLAQAAAIAPDAMWTPEQAPALAASVAERDAAAAQVAVEQKKWLPDVGVSVGLRKFGWSTDRAATIGITAFVPLFDRNQGAIDAARERADAASQRTQAMRLNMAAAHRYATVQTDVAARRLAAAEQGEAAAIEAYRLGRVGYEAGKTSMPELLAIRRALIEAQLLTVDARLARIRALATLSVAEGRNHFGVSP